MSVPSVDIPTFIDRAATCFTRCPSCMKKHPIPSPANDPGQPVNKPCRSRGRLSPPYRNTPNSSNARRWRHRCSRERERERQRREKKNRSVVLLARHKHILRWAGLHTILWPPVVTSGACKLLRSSGALHRQYTERCDNIIAVLGRFLRKVSAQLGLCVSVSA